MTNSQAAALTRIARLCARRGDYSALRAYVDAMLAAPDVRPHPQPDGTHSYGRQTCDPQRCGRVGVRVFGWRLW